MVYVYMGKRDALESGSSRGISLLEHALKILERIVEATVRRIVKMKDMQFGFMAGIGTTDAIFIVRQLQEKFLAKKKDLWMAFVDLEKAFVVGVCVLRTDSFQPLQCIRAVTVKLC